jgi:hypothetical protein
MDVPAPVPVSEQKQGGVPMYQKAIVWLFTAFFMIFVLFKTWKLGNLIGNPREIFETTFLLGKLGLIVVLLIFAFANSHKSYVANNPRSFLTDSIVTGLMAGIAALFLCFMRGRRDLFIPHFIFSLLFFFFYNVTREFAGYFALMGQDKRTAAEKKENQLGLYPIMGIALVMLGVYMPRLAYIVKDQPPFGLGKFGLELIAFSTLLSFGEVVVARNHGVTDKEQVNTFASSFVLFAWVHVLLQYGGVYSEFYSKLPNGLN